ncbi:MAG TPA: RNA-binding S4 domain-containing protein [Clostridia bacterium]|nr:RNA-binding S4 domain-containing protein [Clostridia bacterium]
MRIDKYLKVSRIIKRRTIAQEFCRAGKVKINGKIAKPSERLELGDMLTIQFGRKIVEFEVLELRDSSTKDNAAQMYREVIS